MKRLIPSPPMAVALLALFVALTGSAYAGVRLSKNSVTSSAIRKNAVTSSKIKKSAVTNAKIKKGAVTASKVKTDSLTGTQINESTLAGVNAATLGGQAPSAFFPSSSLVHFNVAMNRGDAPHTLATFGPFTLTGSCSPNGATNFDAVMTVTSSNSQSYYPYYSTHLTQGVPYTLINDTNESPTGTTYSSTSPTFFDDASGLTVFDGDGEQLAVLTGFPSANCRFVGSFVID